MLPNLLVTSTLNDIIVFSIDINNIIIRLKP